MGSFFRRTSRFKLLFLIATLALLGLEIDVRSNPFTPDFVFNQIAAL